MIKRIFFLITFVMFFCSPACDIPDEPITTTTTALETTTTVSNIPEELQPLLGTWIMHWFEGDFEYEVILSSYDPEENCLVGSRRNEYGLITFQGYFLNDEYEYSILAVEPDGKYCWDGYRIFGGNLSDSGDYIEGEVYLHVICNVGEISRTEPFYGNKKVD